MNNLVSENIGKTMLLRKFTQQELADKSGLSRNTINKTISVHLNSNPKLSTLIKISESLNIDFPQLFLRDPNVNKNFNEKMNLNNYMEIFIQNIEIKIRGRSQKFLSGEPGIQESTISEILNRKNLDPKLSTLESISKQIDVSLADLFQRGGNMR